MEPPNSSAAYLARCVECFLVAVGEAQTLVLKGDFGGRLDNALRFASDLLETIGREQPQEKTAAAHYPIGEMRQQLKELQSVSRPR